MDDEIKQLAGYHITLAAHLLQNEYNRALSDLGVTPAQSKALYLLNRYGSQSQTELQDRMYIKGSTMNGIIDSLDKKQLIHKGDSTSDRRVKVITLTPEGTRLEREIWAMLSSLEERLMTGISPERKQELIRTIEQLQKNVTTITEGVNGKGEQE